MTTYTINQSSELMENYQQADILEPQKAFTALQTNTGASLLFSIDTDGVLFVTEELQGKAHGWARVDISSDQAAADFPDGAMCKSFAAEQRITQNPDLAEIHLMMVLNDGENDHLYISLNNKDSDQSWVQNMTWVSCPFNAKDTSDQPVPRPMPFEIAGVFVSEASDKEYIVVDIIRNPQDTASELSRFWLNVSDPLAPVWEAHDLAIDINSQRYESCLGRSDKAFDIDGIYTAGTVDGNAQLIYTPLYNAFDPSIAPSPARLVLEGDATAEVIAALRKPDNNSDLYAIAKDGLYLFESSNQKDKAVGPLLFRHGLFSGTSKLFASLEDGVVTVWGLSGSDAVFYVTCDATKIADPKAWSHPVPILAGVDAISPYIDRQYSANCFFAHQENSLVKMVKSPTTSIWSRREITLPAADKTKKARKISTYTTRIHVAGDVGQGVSAVPVKLSAANVTSVYINHLYYRVGPDPIEIKTDALGSITIVEQAQSLAATRFSASIASQNLEINPMEAPFQRNTKLDSVDALKSAVITNQDGSVRPFIPAGTPEAALQSVAQTNQNLSKAYASLDNAPLPKIMPRCLPEARAAYAGEDGEEGIWQEIGDLFGWLWSGAKAVIKVIKDTATGVWQFVVKIAGKVYYAVLDAVEKVVAAALWIYKEIKIAIEDVIQFLQFLFGWQDILTTHDVMKNILIQTAKHSISELATIKSRIQSIFGDLQHRIDTWADIPDFNQTPTDTASANPAPDGVHGAPANLGTHHFQNNAGDSESNYQPFAPVESIFTELIKLLGKEEDTILKACAAVKSEIMDKFGELTVTQIIKKFLAILADTVLQSVDNILEALIDVLIDVSEGLLDALTASIQIPVLSSLYHDLTGNELSVLDLVCLIAAIPATIVFKIGSKAAPFPLDSAFTKGLLAASNFNQVKDQFLRSPTVSGSSSGFNKGTLSGAFQESVADPARMKVFGVVSGIFATVSSIGLIVVKVKGYALRTPSGTFALMSCVLNLAYISPNFSSLIYRKNDVWYSIMNNELTLISAATGFIPLVTFSSRNNTVQGISPLVETLLNLIWNVPVIANLAYNSKFATSSYKALIPESIGNFGFNIGGMMDFPVFLGVPPNLKPVFFAVQLTGMGIYGAMMPVAGGINEWVPGQTDGPPQ